MTTNAEDQLLALLARLVYALEAIAGKKDPKFEPLGKPLSAAELRRGAGSSPR
jgi:hypothetical protein